MNEVDLFIFHFVFLYEIQNCIFHVFILQHVHPKTISNGSSISRTPPPWRKQKILLQWIKHTKNTILSKEVEDSALMVQAHQASSLVRKQKILP